MYTPVNTILLYKSGVWGSQNYMGVFSWYTLKQSTETTNEGFKPTT